MPAITALLLVVGQALTPNGLDRPITTVGTALRELPIAARHTDRLYVSNLLVVLGLGALGLSFTLIARLVRVHSVGVATALATVGAIGAYCGALANLTIGFNLAAAATARTSADAAAHVLVSGGTSVVSDVLFTGYLCGVALATLLAAIALWRSRTRPRWLAPLFVVGLPLAAAAPPGIIAIPLSLPLVLAMFVLAIRIRDGFGG